MQSVFSQILDTLKQNMKDLKPLLQYQVDQQTLLHRTAGCSSDDVKQLFALYKSQKMTQVAGVVNKEQNTALMEYIRSNHLLKELDSDLGQNLTQSNKQGDNILHLIMLTQPESFLVFSQRYPQAVVKELLEQFNEQHNSPLHSNRMYQVANQQHSFRSQEVLFNVNQDLISCWMQAIKTADLVYISNQRSLFRSGMFTKLVEMLFEAGCSLYDAENPPMQYLSSMTGTPASISQLFEKCIGSLPVEQAVHCLLLMGKLEHPIVQKCQPIQNELFVQLIMKQMVRQSMLSVNYVRHLLVKFGFFRCSESLKLYENSQPREMIDKLLLLNLPLNENDVYKLTTQQYNNFYNKFQFLLTEENCHAFFKAISYQFIQFQNQPVVDYVFEHVRLTDESRKQIIRAISTVANWGQHPGLFGSQEKPRPDLKQQLMEYVRQNKADFLKLNLQQIVDELEVKTQSAAEFMEELGVEYFKKQRANIPETELIEYNLTLDDIRAIKEKLPQQQEATLTQITQIYSTNIDNILHRNGYPLQLIGFNKRPYRCGTFLVYVKKEHKQYKLVKRFINLPVFNQQLYINPHIFNNNRKLKVVFEDANPDTVFREFLKVVQQKSNQSFEQIVAEESNFEATMGQKFTFYLYRPFKDLHVEVIDSKFKGLHRDYAEFIARVGLHGLDFIERNLQQLQNFGSLSSKMQFNVYLQLFGFTKIPYQSVVDEVAKYLARLSVLARLLKGEEVLKLKTVTFLNKPLTFMEQQPNIFKVMDNAYLATTSGLQEFEHQQNRLNEKFVCIGYSNKGLCGYEINDFGCVYTNGEHGQVQYLFLGKFE